MNQKAFENEIKSELNRILDFWKKYSPDHLNGGFIGGLNLWNEPNFEAPKGGVLNARILWSFSVAFQYSQNKTLALLADRAYAYIISYFLDHIHGGTYWALNADSTVLDGRKQTYGLAFTLYAFAEYSKINPDPSVLENAKKLYFEIENHAFDGENGGYWEAFSQNWEKLEDVRLSEKDRNDPKTMNTHLHVIEAYANLYQVWPDHRLRESIIHLLNLFENHFVDPNTFQLQLFFDEEWQVQSSTYSYGHNIEASWLLYESAEIIGDETLKAKWAAIALKMTDATTKGLLPDGSLLHEYDPVTHHADTHREWWVSAEAMVGYMNAYQISQKKDYLTIVAGFWNFIKNHLIDKQHGEWFWGINDTYQPVKEGKIGFWKCPYHNVRACLELLKRLQSI